MSYFSYSQLALYKSCPRKFWYMRVDKSVTDSDGRRSFIGDVLGLLMEWFYHRDVWREGPAASTVLQGFVVEAASAVEHAHPYLQYPWVTGEREEWLRVAHEAVPCMISAIKRERLLSFAEVIQQDGTTVVRPAVRTEWALQVLLPSGDTVVGRLDLLLRAADGSLILLDGKGGGSIGRFVKTDQLRFYMLGVLAAVREFPTKVGFWWFRHDRIVWRQIRRSALPKFVAGVEATIAQLRAKDFTPKAGPMCNYCPALFVCEAGQEFRAVIATKIALPDGDAVTDVSL